MAIHPITGITTCTIAGETRTLRFDMNCAAALFESKGEQWNQWLVQRFLGESDGEGGRTIKPITPLDTVTVLHALLASDREDSGREETEPSLRRTVSPAELPELQLVMLRVVLAGFGLPGEAIEAVVGAIDTPRVKPAPGIGTGPSRSPSVRSTSRRTASGGSR